MRKAKVWDARQLPAYLTVAQYGELMGICPKTVRRMCQRSLQALAILFPVDLIQQQPAHFASFPVQPVQLPVQPVLHLLLQVPLLSDILQINLLRLHLPLHPYTVRQAVH